MNCGCRNFVGQAGRAGAWTLREREDVEVGERQSVDKRNGGGVVFFRLAGETGDYVGSNGRVREMLADEFDAARVVLGAIPAVHDGADAIGGGLQRHMEM